MKYIEFPVEEIDDIPAIAMRTKREALQEILKHGTECNEIK